MTGALDLTTSQRAARAMLDAGAIFTVVYRDDALAFSFSNRVANGGDADLCRSILTAVKEKPPAFFDAFKVAVQRIADERLEAAS